MFVLNIAVIGTALSQSLVLDGGILLERSGSLFLSRQKSHHNVIITRPVPRNPFLELDISNCDVDTCQEFFKSQRWNKKECIDNLGETRLTSLLTAIDDRFTRELLDLKEEAEFVWEAMRSVFESGYSTADLSKSSDNIELVATDVFGDLVMAKLEDLL